MRGPRWADASDTAAIEGMKRKVPENVTACFDMIDRAMFKGPWVMGDAFTVCDPYLFTISNWLEGDSVDTKRFPRIIEHRERVGERAATKRALAMESG